MAIAAPGRTVVWMRVRSVNVLREAITASGRSQREIAVIAEVSHGFIGQLATGRTRTMRPFTAARIAGALGMSVDDLFDACSEANPDPSSSATRDSSSTR